MKKVVLFSLIAIWSSLSYGQNALSQAEALFEADDFQASSEILTSFIQKNPHRKYDIARAWFLQAQNLFAQGEFLAALAANDSSLYQRNLLRSDGIAENYWLKGKIFLSNDDVYGAIDALNTGLNLSVDDPLLYADLYRLGALAYQETEQYQEAISYLEIALEILAIEVGEQHPAVADIHFLWGELLLQTDQQAEALIHINKAFWLHPNIATKTKALFLSWQIYNAIHLNE